LPLIQGNEGLYLFAVRRSGFPTKADTPFFAAGFPTGDAVRVRLACFGQACWFGKDAARKENAPSVQSLPLHNTSSL
jgi:hypothetical protein